MKEAQYNCCWNANYCNETCQQSHWPEHMDSCTQIQQQAGERTTPASSHTPIQKTAPPNSITGGGAGPSGGSGQLSPSLAMGVSAGGIPQGMVGGMPAGAAASQDPQQGFMFPGAAAAAAQAQTQAQAQAQSFTQAHVAHAQAQAIQAQVQLLSQQQQQHQGGQGGAGGQQQGRMSPMGMVNHSAANSAQVNYIRRPLIYVVISQ